MVVAESLRKIYYDFLNQFETEKYNKSIDDVVECIYKQFMTPTLVKYDHKKEMFYVKFLYQFNEFSQDIANFKNLFLFALEDEIITRIHNSDKFKFEHVEVEIEDLNREHLITVYGHIFKDCKYDK